LKKETKNKLLTKSNCLTPANNLCVVVGRTLNTNTKPAKGLVFFKYSILSLYVLKSLKGSQIVVSINETLKAD